MATHTWSTYRESIGDRSTMFAAVHELISPHSVLYLGSYLDLAPSTAFGSVTYVDLDRRAARFFADTDLVRAELEGRTLPGAAAQIEFVQGDYDRPLAVPSGHFDPMISLYAGPTWNTCRHHLAPGGWFLANASHGDASLAALDAGVRLEAVVQHRQGVYRLDASDLESYLIPKKPADADADLIRSRGRGVAYTTPAFAYLFRLLTPDG